MPSRSCSRSPAIHTEGSTRRSVRLSSDSRSGPGRISGCRSASWTLLNTIEMSGARVVGSPWTSMNWAAVGHRLEDDDESAGSCSDRTAFSPGGNSTESIVIFLDDLLEAVFRQVDARTPEDLAVIFPRSAGSCGSCAAIRRTRGLTVNVTSTISSRVGSYPAAHSAQSYSSCWTRLERRGGIEHAAAAGTQHVPRQFEQAEPRGMQKGGDRRTPRSRLDAGRRSRAH